MDFKKIQRLLLDEIEVLDESRMITGIPTIKITKIAKELEKALLISRVSNSLAIKFADALLKDFEMSEFENEDLCWKLCGVPHKMTTSEVYDRYIDEILANDC